MSLRSSPHIALWPTTQRCWLQGKAQQRAAVPNTTCCDARARTCAGVLLWSLLLLRDGHDVLGGAAFAVLLNLKHLFAYLAPLFFVYLLRHFVLQRAHDPATSTLAGGTLGAVGRLTALGSAVAAVFAASLGPFVAMGQLQQVRTARAHGPACSL
jgi:ALG6, ALG8 glycosyltransferase family